MALYLVQHGVSLTKDVDPERGLSEGGIADTERIADVARTYGVNVSRIRHSGKARARQTAEIFASALRPAGGVEKVEGLNPLDDVTLLAPSLQSSTNLMVVGHLPFLGKLTSYLVVGSTENPLFSFQNSGIVCLDEDPGNGWVITWTLMPKIG